MAYSFGETVIGIYADTSDGIRFGIHPEDQLFAVGNGTSDDRNNALTVYKSGEVKIDQRLVLDGHSSEYGQGNDDAVIYAAPHKPGSDLFLVSNDYVEIWLDDDNNSNSNFRVFNGEETAVLTLLESGNLAISGSLFQGSDERNKVNIHSISTLDVLDKLASVPIKRWQYKGQETKHIGPMAQDFYRAFGYGQGPTTISAIDADGVSFAAIQALYEEIKYLRQEIKDLKAQ